MKKSLLIQSEIRRDHQQTPTFGPGLPSFNNRLLDKSRRMVSSQGIEVTVAVDGQNLQEYGDDAEETVPNTVTKYIEAASGAHFSVKYGHTQDFLKQHEIEGVIYKIKIDGITMRRPVLDGTNHSGEVHGKYSQVRGVDMFQGFRFSDIKIGKFVLTGQACN